MSGDGAIRHSSPHPPEARYKRKCGGCRLQAELDGLRGARTETRLVEIEWYDSERVTLGWASAEDYLAALADRSVYRTAGYFIGEDADHIMVALSRSDSGMFSDAIVIPRAVVIGVADLAAEAKP